MSNVLRTRGICYDTGVNYTPDALSRTFWHVEAVAADMRVIASDLGCTAVAIFGTRHERLRDAAELALAEGLDVWLQPRLIEATSSEMIDHMVEAAKLAEVLRERHPGKVTLNVGCELSLFMKGVLPGRNFMWRMRGLLVAWMAMPLFNRKLNVHLHLAATRAREHFGGPLAYSAGEWEGVDWRPFDSVGVDYYRERLNASTYVAGLRALARHGKPVIITEFGCCSFRGAARRGGGGFLIVNWLAQPPTVKRGHLRDEAEQAATIESLVRLYQEEGVDGAFVYAFSEPRNLHTDDPRTDLDMASYGIVKIVRRETADEPEEWQPKEAFVRLAALYRDGT